MANYSSYKNLSAGFMEGHSGLLFNGIIIAFTIVKCTIWS